MFRFINVVAILVTILVLVSFKPSIIRVEKGSSFAGIDNKKWETLFDGKTFKGWHLYGKNYAGNCWHVEQNALHLLPCQDESSQGDLVTDKIFENFDLQL